MRDRRGSATKQSLRRRRRARSTTHENEVQAELTKHETERFDSAAALTAANGPRVTRRRRLSLSSSTSPPLRAPAPGRLLYFSLPSFAYS